MNSKEQEEQSAGSARVPGDGEPLARTTGVDRGYAPILDRLMDLELPVCVILGGSVLPIRDVLKLTAGSLIELDRQLGDSVELSVHGKVVARGEVVSVKGSYGVRIKEIISHEDRMALQDGSGAGAPGLK